MGDSTLTAVKGEDQEAAPRASPFDKNAPSHTAGSRHSWLSLMHASVFALLNLAAAHLLSLLYNLELK